MMLGYMLLVGYTCVGWLHMCWYAIYVLVGYICAGRLYMYW